MTPEQRRYALVKVVWETKNGERKQTPSFFPEDLPAMLSSIRKRGRSLYAFRYRRRPPYGLQDLRTVNARRGAKLES